MRTSKRLGRGFASAIFKFALLVIPVLLAANIVLKPDNLKDILKESNVYSSFADGLVEQVKEDKKEVPPNAAPTPTPAPDPVDAIKDPIVQEAVKKTITPEFTQSTAEQIIDGTYSWLEGETESPTFNIDLAPIKTNIVSAAADGAIQRATTLPVCTQAQLQQLDPNTDAFSLNCLPPGFDLQAARQKLIAEGLASNEVIEDTTLSAENVKAEGKQQNAFEEASYIPTIYQWSQIAPWILGALGILAAVGVVMLDDERRKGIKSLSRTLLVVGILLLVSIMISKFFTYRIEPDALAKSVALQNSAIHIVKALSNAFNNVLMLFAVGYLVLGGGGLTWLHFTKPGQTPVKTTRKPSSAPRP